MPVGIHFREDLLMEAGGYSLQGQFIPYAPHIDPKLTIPTEEDGKPEHTIHTPDDGKRAASGVGEQGADDEVSPSPCPSRPPCKSCPEL